MSLSIQSLLVLFCLCYFFLAAISLEITCLSKDKHENLILNLRNRTILAFGDSLTWGLFVDGDTQMRGKHSYTMMLKSLLNSNSTLGQLPEVRIVEKGINGEDTRAMLRRFPHIYRKSEAAVVIILAGTNDLGKHTDSLTITNNIISLHRTATEQVNSANIKANSIAITIPQISWTINQQDRISVNRELRSYYSSKVNNTRNATTVLDFENLFDQKIEESKKYWSIDFVHFSQLGYDTIGKIIYETLLETFMNNCKS